MRQQLKRIEATLDQLASQGLNAQQFTPVPKTSAFSRNSSLSSLLDQPNDRQSEFITPDQAEFTHSFSVTPTTRTSSEFDEVVQPFSVQQQAKLPVLPRFKSATFTSHRNGSNPALAMNLLREIETIVAGWQTELHQILQQIQDLYLEGPIVDGWLESQSAEDEIAIPPLRHAEVSRLIDYVDDMCAQPQAVNSSRAGYRLCGLNPDGQLWCRPCPPDQVPSVSLAIARYHKLRQLLSRKQELETRLTQLAETLIVLHGHLK
jgi:hypothetical protein